MDDRITRERLDKYLSLTHKGLLSVELLPPVGSHPAAAASDFFSMAQSYYRDAVFYFQKEDYVTSFAAVNYAHGYLDAGIRLGVFKGSGEGLFAFDSNSKEHREMRE